MSGITWLASYPKSGNTWMRIFLLNYILNSESPVNIDELQFAPIAASRVIFDDYSGVESGDLTFEEVDCYRPGVYREYAKSSEELLFSKVHDAYTYLNDGSPIFPADATSGVIYIIRNPLDVAPSFASHNHSSADRAIENMGKACFELCGDPSAIDSQLRQKLLSWSTHISSWLEAPGLRVHLVRYEDMISQPVETFAEVIRFVSLEEDADRLHRAIEFSSFEELQKQEQTVGFNERAPVSTEPFFRKGKVGGWRNELTEAQAQQIVHDHAEMMRRFGYLSPDGQIVY